MISRRNFLKSIGLTGLAGGLFASYATLIAPYGRRIRRHRVTPKAWPDGLNLRIAALADLHVADPWMTPALVRKIVAETNALEPDLIVLLGDYVAGPSHVLPTGGTARFASGLSANSFLRSSSAIYYTRQNVESVADDLQRMAEKEGLIPLEDIGRAALSMVTMAPGTNVLSSVILPLTQPYLGRG